MASDVADTLSGKGVAPPLQAHFTDLRFGHDFAHACDFDAEGVKRMLEKIEDWRDAPVWDPASIERATESWFRYLDESKG